MRGTLVLRVVAVFAILLGLFALGGCTVISDLGRFEEFRDIDAGPPDSGARPDAGPPDGGPDAGTVDGGPDAGPVDASITPMMDAGSSMP